MRPAFGASTSTGTFGGFGSSTGFGNNNQSSLNRPSTGITFGNQPTTGFGASSSGLGSPSPFGAASPFAPRTTTGFGSGTSTFGGSTGTSAFGGPSTFGAATTSAGFGGGTTSFGGASTGLGGSTFGSSTTAFGASAPAFGSTTPAFGGGATSFGGGGFGASTFAPNRNTSPGGTVPTFGAAATPFGKTTSTGFGNTQTASPFLSNTGFGAGATSFGASAPAFGASAPTAFGSTTSSLPASTGFGTPIGFGASQLNAPKQVSFGPTVAFGSNLGADQSTGTLMVPFVAPQIKENVQRNGITNTVTAKLLSISGMPQYENKSFDELRWEDYQKGQKTAGAASTFGGGGAFGSAAKSSFSFGSSGFGQQQSSPFQATALGSASAAPAFGSTLPSTGFGTSTSAGFGSTAPSAGAFGAPTAASNPFASSFGGAQPNLGTFGQSTLAQPSFGSPSTFGGGTNPAFSATTSLGAGSFGGFGTTNPTSTFGQPNAFGGTTTTGNTGAPAFGGASTFGSGGFGGATGFGSFGKTNTGFGSSLGTTAPAATGFGTTLSGFGTTTGGVANNNFGLNLGSATKPTGFFGQTPGFSLSQTTSGFGFPSSNTQTTGFTGLSQPSFPGLGNVNVQPDINQKIEYLKKKTDDLEIHMPTDKSSTLTATETTTDSSSSSIPAYAIKSLGSRKFVRSSAKIIPRGYVPRDTTSANKQKDDKSEETESLQFLKSDLKKNVKRLMISDSRPMPSGSKTIRDFQSYQVSSQSREDDKQYVETPSKQIDKSPKSFNQLDEFKYDHDQEFYDRSSIQLSDSRLYGDKTGLTPAEHNSPNISLNRDVRVLSPMPIKHVAFTENDLKPQKNKEESLNNIPLYYDISGPPKLTREGYGCIPDIKILNNLNDYDLSHIKNFTVYRKGFGEIVWEEETDIRGLDLDSIVSIEHKEVRVYDDEAAPVERGKGLNKPATVTLHKVFPKDLNKIDEYVNKLKKFCESTDAEFISYNKQYGDWAFHVDHFSKYGIQDSDDEDESAATGSNVAKPNINIVKSSIANASDMSYSKSDVKKLQISFKQYPSSEEKHSDNRSVSFDDDTDVISFRGMERSTFSRRSHRGHNALARKRNIHKMLDVNVSSQSLQDNRSDISNVSFFSKTTSIMNATLPVQSSTSFEQIEKLNDSDDENDNFLYGGTRFNSLRYQEKYKEMIAAKAIDDHPSMHDHPLLYDFHRYPVHFQNSPFYDILKSIKQNYFTAIGVKPIQEDYSRITGIGGPIPSVLQKPMKNYTLTMGRSFRVGFNAFGQIAHIGDILRSDNDFGKDQGLASIEKVDIPFRRRIIVERIDSFSWITMKSSMVSPSLASLYVNPKYIEASLMEPIEAIQRYSYSETTKSNEKYPVSDPRLKVNVPIWKTPECNPNSKTSYVAFLDILKSCMESYNERSSIIESSHASSWHPDSIILKALSLINASVGQEREIFLDDKNGSMLEYSTEFDIMPFVEDKVGFLPSQTDRRKRMIQLWFQTCSSIEDYENNEDDYYHIFELLTNQRIADAVEYADDHNLFRLSMILSQVDNDVTISHLIRHQLDIWKCQRADEVMPLGILQIYRLISGDFFPSDMWDDSILKDTSWLSAIGTLYMYSIESKDFPQSLAIAIDCYDKALEEGWVSTPLLIDDMTSDSMMNAESHDSKGLHQHGLYSLLRLLFPPCHNTDQLMPRSQFLRNVLNPLGYTRDLLDYRSSYQLLVLLEAMGYFNSNESIDIDSNESFQVLPYIVRQHFISQLLSFGLWKWALFVAMQINDDRVRSVTVKDIIFRYAGSNAASSNTYWEDNQLSDESFVMSTLSISGDWLYEATGHRYLNSYLFQQATHYYLLSYRTLSYARQTSMEKIAFPALQNSAKSIDSFLLLLEELASMLKAVESNGCDKDLLLGSVTKAISGCNDGLYTSSQLNVIGHQMNKNQSKRRQEEMEYVLQYLRYRKVYHSIHMQTYSAKVTLDDMMYKAVSLIQRAIMEGGICNKKMN